MEDKELADLCCVSVNNIRQLRKLKYTDYQIIENFLVNNRSQVRKSYENLLGILREVNVLIKKICRDYQCNSGNFYDLKDINEIYELIKDYQ